ncbi:MAG: hypothetical protein FJ276_19345 [Planctomycetes bacterium]|nr:hypothetical protein [Planctomycetota bacterium]
MPSKGMGWAASIVSAARRLAKLVAGGNAAIRLGAVGALLTIGAFTAWAKWGGLITNGSMYALGADTLQVTPQPAWIHSDVKAEVLRDGSLTSASLLDPDLTHQVVRAFELHTWVAEVTSAGKRLEGGKPRMVVTVRYREPVIMVRARDPQWEGDCFYPVDTEGIFLPPDEFSRTQTRNYLRVDANNALPVGPVGTPYGDPGVTGAAMIAQTVQDSWKAAGLAWIVTQRDAKAEIARLEQTSYVLLPLGASPDLWAKRTATQLASTSAPDAPEVLWGRAPGYEDAGEAKAFAKAARLVQFVQKHGQIDQLPGDTSIDLRPATGIQVNARGSAHP